jgi:short-subunit dehydrogenase
VNVDEVLSGQVMTAEDMVDASLVAFDHGEFATVPALPNVADWNAFEAARNALRPNLSHASPADRYKADSRFGLG